jgi:multiple sugar transport system permease protein
MSTHVERRTGIEEVQRLNDLGAAENSLWLRRVRKGLLYALLSLISIMMALPFIAMILIALRPAGATGLTNVFFSSEFTFNHFTEVLQASSLPRWFLNSAIYSLVSLVLVLLLSSMAGYAFAKKRFPGKSVLFWTFIAMLVVPAQVSIVPLFILIVQLGWGNTYQGLIVPTLASAQGVFLLRQYILGIPNDLIEAAVIDGASEFRIYWQIILPLCTPILATLGIFVFLWHWNDFLWPLVVAQSNDMRTLTVGLATLEQMVPSVNQIMAAAAISFLPSLAIFVVLQRYIAESISITGMKG